MTSSGMAQRNYLLMKMMKRENLGKFIMMMRLSIGDNSVSYANVYHLREKYSAYKTASFVRLLDREQVGDEEANLDEPEEDGFLKAFKVCHCSFMVLYI